MKPLITIPNSLTNLLPDQMKTKFHSLFIALLCSNHVLAVVTGDGLNLGTSNTVPTGSNSIGGGFNNTTAESSISFGTGNSSQYSSLALGEGNTSHNLSISSGYVNTVDLNSWTSAAIGEANYVGYSASTVLLGAYNTMGLQWGSGAIGNSNSLQTLFGRSGSGNVLIGQLNMIDQTGPNAPIDLQGTVLVGCDNQSSETMAYAFGLGNIAQNRTVTTGTYAQPVQDAAMIVGKGTANTSRSNGLVVYRNGLVDIPGNLSVGGTGVITQGNAGTTLSGQGFLKKSTGNGASAHPSAIMAIGVASNAAENALALGEVAFATSFGSIAIGDYSSASNNYAIALQGGNASGNYSFSANWGQAWGDFSIALMGGYAPGMTSVSISGRDPATGDANWTHGIGSTAIGGSTNQANGDYSYAFGWNSIAIGRHSYSIGHLTRTNGYAVSMGSQNLSANNLLPNMENESWAENGALFELGNGRPNDQGGSNDYSNAITTLKNGQTTLTNKAWKANPSTPLEDPTTANTDSSGEALVVEGHTRLKGKVIIEQPQGDISMGIYQ